MGRDFDYDPFDEIFIQDFEWSTGHRPSRAAVDKVREKYHKPVIGGVYRRPAGAKPVVLIGTNPAKIKYLQDGCAYVLEYSAKKLIPYNKTLTELEHRFYAETLKELNIKGENTMTTKLYEVAGAGPVTGTIFKTFAHKLAVNSEGLWVMEEKGTGRVFTTDKSKVEEVMPYTVDIQFEGDKQSYSYTFEKDRLKKDDFIMVDSYGWKIAKVAGVNTKSRHATKELPYLGKIVLDK